MSFIKSEAIGCLQDIRNGGVFTPLQLFELSMHHKEYFVREAARLEADSDLLPLEYVKSVNRLIDESAKAYYLETLERVSRYKRKRVTKVDEDQRVARSDLMAMSWMSLEQTRKRMDAGSLDATEEEYEHERSALSALSVRWGVEVPLWAANPRKRIDSSDQTDGGRKARRRRDYGEGCQ